MVLKNYRTGRPSKLTPKIQEMILDCIRMGLTYSKAAELVGITRHTLLNWRKWGQAEKSGIYFNFFNALQKAEAEGEIQCLQKIQEAARGGQEIIDSKELYQGKKLIKQITKTVKSVPDWRAAAWILERRYPERYGRRRNLDDGYHQIYGDYEIYIIAKALSKMSKSELERLKLLLNGKDTT